MRETSEWTRAWHALTPGLVLAVGVVGPAAAYVGPGAGVSAIGAVLAVMATLFLAVVGFIWYPVKRLLRKRRAGWKPGQRTAHASGDD